MNNNRGIDPYNNRYRLNIVHLYPDLLNLYGDRGNIQCMRMRCRWRGIDAQVTECNLDDPLSLASADIVLLGGGSDREQQIVCTRLQKIRQDLRAYVEDGGSMLAVCGGYQLLGHYYDTPEGRMEVLSLVDLYTEQGSPLQTTAFPPSVKGCIPSGVSPIMARRLKPREPFPVFRILLSSGPLEIVLESISSTLSGSACPLQ